MIDSEPTPGPQRDEAPPSVRGSHPQSDGAEWSKVKPVRRDAASEPYRAAEYAGRDLFAEGQVRGLALAVFGVAGLQGMATVFLSLVARKAPVVPDPELRANLLVVVAPILLLLALAARIAEKRSFVSLAPFVIGLFGLFMVWISASLAYRGALSMGATAGLSVLLALGLWGFRPMPRLFAAGWALLALYPVWTLLSEQGGSVLYGLHLGILPVGLLITLFAPQTGKVFGDRYDAAQASRDPRPVPLLRSVPLWGFAAWVVVLLFMLVPPLLSMLR